MLNRNEIDRLWEEGFRPFEIYIFNSEAVEYLDEMQAPGTIPGWDIVHVFARRTEVEEFPFFDEVIGGSVMHAVEYLWKDGEKTAI